MKRLFFLPLVLLAFLLSNCDEDTFEYQMYVPQASEVDSIYFSTGTKSLIADGNASLRFVVEAFRTATFTSAEGHSFDSLVMIKLNELPDGAVKIIDESGSEVGMTYSTDDFSQGTKEFYVQIGDTQSEVKSVTLREKPILPTKLYVDVVFHVFELKSTDPLYDPLSYLPIEQEMLVAAMEDLNGVFNNQLGNGPNGASANIEFRLAEKDYMNRSLENPGYHRIQYDQSFIPEPQYSWQTKRTYFQIGDFVDYIDEKVL